MAPITTDGGRKAAIIGLLITVIDTDPFGDAGEAVMHKDI